MNIDSWKSQLCKGAAELAVLAILKRKSASGTKLLDILSDYPEIGLSDGTIYPLLSRLERDGRINGAWETPKGGGRGQKIYTITSNGKIALKTMNTAWTGFKEQLSIIIGDPS